MDDSEKNLEYFKNLKYISSKDDSEKDLEYFKNLKYDIVVRKNEDTFLLYIHELCLVTEDKNLEQAYVKMESNKENYFKKMIENHFQEHIEEPEGREIRKTFSWNLAPFFIKLTVVVLVTFIFLKTIDHISPTFRYLRRASKNISRINFLQTTNDISQISMDVSQVTKDTSLATKDVSHLTKDISLVTNDILKLDIPQIASDFSQTLNTKQTVVNVADITDKKQTIEEEKRTLSTKHKLLTPIDFYASNSVVSCPVTFAFDSNPDTYWKSTKHSAYLVVKLKRPSKLESLSLTLRKDVYAGKQGPDEYTIEGSNNNKNWKLVDEISQLKWEKGESKIIVVENNNNIYKYYKFNFTKKKKFFSYVSLTEMELYGN